MITVTAFQWVPDFAQGYVKDLRVRWALEEAGLPYQTRLIDQEEKNSPDYRAIQPFGQVPVYEEDGIRIFESGAIVLHVGEKCEALLPKEPGARARTQQWVAAALNSIEPFVAQLAVLDLFYKDEQWAGLRRPSLEALVRGRIGALSDALGDKPNLDGERFTAGDLMMVTVLRQLDRSPILSDHSNLAAYMARGMARPAFKRAYDAQLSDFKKAA